MPISQFLLDTKDQNRQKLRIRNKWMIRLRWIYISLLTSVAVVTGALANEDKMAVMQFLLTGVIGMLVNAFLWACTLPKRARLPYFEAVAILQIVIDLALASFLVFSQNGLESRVTVLYAVPILTSGILFRGIFPYFTAVLSGIFYGIALLFASEPQYGNYEHHEITLPLVFYSCVFMLLAVIVARFSKINENDEREKSYAELLSMLRHQLRHPSGVIAAIIEMLENGESYRKITPKDRQYLIQLKHENRRINTMVSNLLEAAEGNGEHDLERMEDVNLIKVVDEAAIACATTHRRMKDLSINYPIESMLIRGQPEQLATAFDNIIDNAFRYSTAGTKVSINITKPKPVIEISIVDHGKGMPADLKKRIFNRFARYDEDEEGALKLYSMGLGLYVSKVIIERHGGSLKVDSATDKGTKVIIDLKKEGES